MKGIKKVLKVAGIGFAALVVIGIIAAMFGGGSDSTKEGTVKQEEASGGETEEKDVNYVSMVQTGCFGEFTDATVKDVLEANFALSGFKLDWSSEVMNGKDFVGFHCYQEGKSLDDGTTILFQICTDETFKVSGYAVSGNEDFESAQIADYINGYYMNWYLINNVGRDASEEEIASGMQKLIREKFDKVSGSAALYGASKDYSGERGKLCKEVDGTEPMDLTVTELMNHYNDNLLDIYTSGAADGNNKTQEAGETAEGDAYAETLYPAEGGEGVIKISIGGDDKLNVWYGNMATEEEYYARTYDSYTFENDVMRGTSGDDVDEFEFFSDGYVDVLLSGYGSTHYQSYMTEETYLSGNGTSGGGIIQIADGNALKDFARDDSNIGSTVTFKAEVGGNFSQLGNYLLYCYCKDGSIIQVRASAVEGLNVLEGDSVIYTGVFDGFTGGGNQLQFNTVSVEVQ